MKRNPLFNFFRNSKREVIVSPENNISPTIAPTNTDAKEYLESSVKKSKMKKYQEALIDINKSIELDPNNAEAYLERGKIKGALKDGKGAEQDLAKAKIIMDRIDSGLKAYDEGDTNYSSDNFKDSIRYYNKAISLIPSLTGIYYNRGLAKKILNDFNGAIEDFNKSIDANASNKAFAYYERGLIKCHKLNDSIGANQDYDKAIELNGMEPDFFYSKAILSDDYEAVKLLTKAIELDPNNARIYFARAIRQYNLEDYNNGIQDLDKFIEINPSDTEFTLSDAYSLRATMKTFKYEFESALQDHNKALEIDPSFTKAFFERGVLKDILKDYEGAIADFTKMIEIDSSDALAYYYRGMSKLKKGNVEEGNIDLNIAKELGYDDYDEEAAKEAAEEAFKKIKEDVEKDIEENGQPSKEELEKEREELYKQLIESLKKTKE